MKRPDGRRSARETAILSSLHHAAAGAAEPHPSSNTRILLGGWSVLLLAAALAVPAFADDDKPCEPGPAIQSPTRAEGMAMRQRIGREQADELANAGLNSAERERMEMTALGFNPDDPVALAAYRAEINANPDAITALQQKAPQRCGAFCWRVFRKLPVK